MNKEQERQRQQALRAGSSAWHFEKMLDDGFFPKEALSRANEKQFCGRYGVDGLIRACELLSEPNRLGFVERLVREGVAGGEDCCVNMTDFAVAGLWDCAQKMKDLGFEPGRCKTGAVSFGLEPMAALLSSFSQRGSSRERFGPKAKVDEAADAAQAKRMGSDIDRWAALGASVTPGPTTERFWWSDNCFQALMASGGFSNERAPTWAMLDELGPKLVKMGADPNEGGWLHWACVEEMTNAKDWGTEFDAERAWDWAVSMGMNPSRFSGKSLTSATRFHHEKDALECVEKLLARGVDPSRMGVDDVDAPVHNAFERDYPKLGWRLIELGAPANGVDPAGETILHVLSKSVSRAKALGKALERPEVLALIEAATNEKRERALHLACAAQSIESIRLLLEHGADANARDAQGWTPMRHLLRKFGASAQKKAEPGLRLLLEHGADPSIADAKGMTPAQAVAAKAPMSALEKLLALRPQDIAGDDKVARETKQKLKGRGGQGASLAERVEIEGELSQGRAPKKKPRGGL